MQLLLLGDVMLGRLVNETLRHEPAEYVWGDTQALIESAEVRICNLECVLADGGEPWTETEKVFHFRSDTRNVRALQAAGIQVVTLANNHTLDYGRDTMIEMLKTLNAAGIHHAGAGVDQLAAAQPAIHPMFSGGLSFTRASPFSTAWAITWMITGWMRCAAMTIPSPFLSIRMGERWSACASIRR
jgi:poly-gamma-glutamate synthesis protein (capsule biosynthesis protein)